MGYTKEDDPQTYAVIGAAMQVHNVLGPGFLESVYQAAMSIELEKRGIPFKREMPLRIQYSGEDLACGFRVDLLCFGDVVVELKATDGINGSHVAQTLNYLVALDFRRGLVINFGQDELDVERVTNFRKV